MTIELQSSPQTGITWYNAGLLKTPHGMFFRTGGVSSPPFAELNLSFGVGDVPDHVLTNRSRIKKCLNLHSLVSATQVHGDQIALVKDTDRDIELSGYDALITSQPGVGLLIQQADCQAILLHDPVNNVVAALHSGWRGSVCNIIGRTIDRMTSEYRTSPTDIRAVISPSLGPCCAEFVNFKNELPRDFQQWQVRENFFDFWAISRFQLTRSGVAPQHIAAVEVCTVCNRDFFSYRRAVKNGSPVTGRNGSVIGLADK